MNIMASAEFANSSTFYGKTVRTIFRQGRSFGQLFRWFDADDDLSSIAGERIVDVYEFNGAAKLGPAVIYARSLPVPSAESVKAYFDGNTSVLADTAVRSKVENDSTIKWSTEEESIEGFRQIYGASFLENHFGPRDVVWGPATELRYLWMSARVIASRGGVVHELILWLPSREQVTDSERLSTAVVYLGTLGYEVNPAQCEFYETHYLHPEFRMCVFQIGKVSRLDETEYCRENFFD
jgi:hypothetical protein